MDILKSSLYPYLQGLHLFNKKPVAMTVSHVKTEMLPDHKGEDQEKFVLYFKETDKGLVLNKTNTTVLVELLGRETDDWQGKKVKLTHAWVKAFGKTVHAIRVLDDDLNRNTNGGPNTSPPMTEAQAIQTMMVEPAPQNNYQEEK